MLVMLLVVLMLLIALVVAVAMLFRSTAPAQRLHCLRSDLTHDALQIVHGGEGDDELASAAAELDADPGFEQVGQALPQSSQSRRLRSLLPGRLPRGLVNSPNRDDLLHGPDR